MSHLAFCTNFKYANELSGNAIPEFKPFERSRLNLIGWITYTRLASKFASKAYFPDRNSNISIFNLAQLVAKMSFWRQKPFALPRLDLPRDQEWAKLFPPSSAAHLSPPSVAVESVGVQVPCEHWSQVLDRVNQVPDLSGNIGIRHFSTHFSPVDFKSLYECEHSLGAALRLAMKDLELWPRAGLQVTCALVKSLAVVMATRLDRSHPLWTKVFDWVVKCIDNPMEDGAWMVGMEFLAQLHVEVDWDLKGEFPELIAKLGDLDDRERFPTGFRYCLEVRSRVPRLNPTIEPGQPSEAQPSCVESHLLKNEFLEELLQYLDYGSIVNLRATCQLVRDAVDDVIKASSRLRRGIRDNRIADLWLRAQPNVSEIKVNCKPKARPPFKINPALVDGGVYATLGMDDGLEMADISSPRPAPMFYTSVHKTGNNIRLWTSFDQMAHEHIRQWKWELCHSHTPWIREQKIKAKDCVISFRYIERTNDAVDNFEISIEDVSIRSYAVENPFHDGWLWLKASYSVETVFMLYRGRDTESGNQFLLEMLDVKSRRITASVYFDVALVPFATRITARIEDPLQCAGDDFIITQIWGYMKAFARVGGEWVNVGEKLIDQYSVDLETLMIRDGLAVWKETTTEDVFDLVEYDGQDVMDLAIAESVVNILDVRPASLARIFRNGENAFELAKKIRVPGNYVIKPFERGFFGFDYSGKRKCVKIKIFDLEVTSGSK